LRWLLIGLRNGCRSRQAVITACRDRHYADGTAVLEMAKAFNDYYNK
jgi:hypothetical protein